MPSSTTAILTPSPRAPVAFEKAGTPIIDGLSSSARVNRTLG
jgi:hypothetical protein